MYPCCHFLCIPDYEKLCSCNCHLHVALGIPGFIIAIILFIVVIVYKSSSDEEKHNEQLQKYENAIIEFKQKLDHYQKQIEIKHQRDIEMEALKANPLLKAMKIWMTGIEFLETSEPPSDRSLDAKKGVTESIFHAKLLSTFGDMILLDKTVFDYTPDFIYFNPKFNLYIDIEIDEPYDGISKDPIHYIGADDVRDYCFLRKKWCVIRFSEKQIIEQPSACCDEIKRTVNKIFLSIYKPEEIKENLTVDKRWTESIANKMAKENYRDTYLFKIK